MDTSPIHVLIVDSSSEDRQTIRRLLTLALPDGYAVTETDRGDSAIVAARASTLDCVLLDYDLPDTDGLAVITALRRVTDVPIVLMAGRGNETLVVQAFHCGAQDYLAKHSLTPEQLRASVERAISTVCRDREHDHSLALLSAQHQVTADLEAREQWLRLALEIAGLNAWDWEVPTDTITYSTGETPYFRLPPGQCSRTCAELRAAIYPADLPIYEQTVGAALAHGGLYQLQIRVAAPDHRLHWIEARGLVQHDSTGKPMRVLGVTRDISVEKRYELAQSLHFAITQALAAAQDMPATLQALARLPLPDLADYCAIYLCDSAGRLQPVGGATDNQPEPVPLASMLPAENGVELLDAVLRSGEPRLLPEMPADLAPGLGSHIRRAALLLPLTTHGNTFGVMLLARPAGALPYDLDDLDLARPLAWRGAAAIRRIQLQAATQAAQRAADEALARLNALVMSAPNGIAYLDRELRYVLVNPALAALNGLAPEAHLGCTPSQLLPPWLGLQIETLVRQVFATGMPLRDLDVPGQATLTDATPHHWLISFFPVSESTGKVAGVGATVTDVTAHKQIEEALRESETRYRTLFETMAQGVVYHDAAGRVLAANPTAERLLGLGPDQLHGYSVFEEGWSPIREDGSPFPKEDFPALAALRTGQIVRDVVLGLCYPGLDAVRWLNIQAIPLILPGEATPTQVYTVFDDITERHQAQHALEQQHRQLDAIIRTLQEGLVAFHPDGTIALINDVGMRIGGIDFDPALTTLAQIGWAMGMLPVDIDGQPLPTSTYPYTRILRGERFSNLELRLWHPERHVERWLVFSGTPVYDSQGSLVLGVVTTHDITQRKQAELELKKHAEALSRMNADLTRALRLKDEFLAMMSHELRTPLNMILGISESLGEGLYGPISERQRQALASLSQSGHHLLVILSDILDLARIAAGAETLERRPVDIELLCQTAMQFIYVAAQQKHIRLLRTIPHGVAWLRADERRLTQILTNLLDNAVKFTPAGGTVALEVQANPDQECLQLIVWDTGIGIADSDYSRLFQPFTQVDGRLARAYGGIGLGLTLVRRLVELHGGSISLESTPGLGSRFTVSLPWSEADNVAQPVARTHQLLTPGWAKPPRIVIADDHELTLQFYAELLRQQECTVATARTGGEALAQVRAAHPDVVVLDVQMPEMDGLTALRKIRADPEISEIPVIVLTALAMPGDREQCLAAGADAYLAKPVSLRTLLTAIVHALPDAPSPPDLLQVRFGPEDLS